MVSIHRPLGYGPSTLPLRHSANLLLMRALLCIYNANTVDAQAQLSAALEKERSATEKMMLLKSRVTSLETQLGSTRQEKSQLLATIELERAKLETLEEGQHR